MGCGGVAQRLGGAKIVRYFYITSQATLFVIPTMTLSASEGEEEESAFPSLARESRFLLVAALLVGMTKESNCQGCMHSAIFLSSAPED